MSVPMTEEQKDQLIKQAVKVCKWRGWMGRELQSGCALLEIEKFAEMLFLINRYALAPFYSPPEVEEDRWELLIETEVNDDQGSKDFYRRLARYVISEVGLRFRTP